MAIYFKEKRVLEFDFGDDVAMAEMSKRRRAAPVPVAVDWNCFATEVDIENTLSVLYATYSRIDKLMIAIPRANPYWLFTPAPSSQTLVFNWRNVHWSVVKSHIHDFLRDHEGFWSSLHTTLRMSGSSRCYHKDDGEECLRKRSRGSGGTCGMPIVCVMELAYVPGDIPDAVPVLDWTWRDQTNLWIELTDSNDTAVSGEIDNKGEEEEEDEIPGLINSALVDPEELAELLGTASSSQQQTQTSAGSYLPDVHCGKTIMWDDK
ncbi:hypothetical protein PG996_001624 [Apiospora saccharicola]|uniref:Ubiquitin-like protease family profile domain-containing protein n=1 Tax=Apiospora saccharicola TaxID=335842 RepID=A0ABR1WH54_9PEZI